MSRLPFLLAIAFTWNAWTQAGWAQSPAAAFDHADYLRGLGETQFERGERLYAGLCVNCHGADGKTPALPLAPAFGAGTLKFGADPFAMFQTLTKGNGLMAPQQWMSPGERYDVIHYIRQAFMTEREDYVAIGDEYLAQLPEWEPEGSGAEASADREFGPALASQLGRDLVSVLTIKLPDHHAIAYNLHSMDMVGLWRGGYLDLSATQHSRLRGEGVPQPAGAPIEGLQTWRWAHGGSFDYPRDQLKPRGPMPGKWLQYHGHYLHGDEVILSYGIDGRDVLELPAKQKGVDAVTRTLSVEPGPNSLLLAVAQAAKVNEVTKDLAVLGGPEAFTAVALTGDLEPLSLSLLEKDGTVVLTIPPSEKRLTFQVVCMSGQGQPALDGFRGLASWKRLPEQSLPDLDLLRRGGSPRWPETFTTDEIRGEDDAAYVIDNITLPQSTPWNTWFRTSALAFADDGLLYVSTHGGDLWSARPLGDGQWRWKRYAAGLYEPFGLEVVGPDVYVTCKDRLVRLRDLNGDGEADFYESFSADEDVSSFFHAYNFDLVRDSEGNFYYVKAGQYTSYALPGAVVKVSPDGGKREIICTGFRTPNGMGILGDDRLTVSDNQGNWIPASKVSLVRPGGYYGYAQTHARPGFWAPDGGRIDHTEEALPQTFDQPLIWMPQHYDNSSGGQLWVDDPRWGPLSGRLLHTSFGKGWLYYFLIQDLDDVAQSAVVRLPLDFDTGIMRARVSPEDGQVYTVGLNGWNGNGRKGLGEGGLYRVRYTGKPTHLVTGARVRDDGLELTFNFAVAEESAGNPDNYRIEQWNYRWLPRYGSDNWSVVDPNKKGKDAVRIAAVERTRDGHGVFLKIPDLQPANQLHLRLTLRPQSGEALFEEELYWTINGFPDGRRWAQAPPYKEVPKKKRKAKPRKEAEEQWIRLFDGGTLTGWTARAEGEAAVRNGEIQLDSKANLWLAHGREFADFILEAEVKLPPAAEGNEGINSGIAFRCQGAEGKPVGYQCEIDGSDRRWTGGLYAIGSGGWLWPQKGNAESEGQFMEMSKGSFQRDAWNRFRIECQGKRIKLFVNGIPTAELEDERFAKGYIALQHHGRGGTYRFRDIRIKPQ